MSTCLGQRAPSLPGGRIGNPCSCRSLAASLHVVRYTLCIETGSDLQSQWRGRMSIPLLAPRRSYAGSCSGESFLFGAVQALSLVMLSSCRTAYACVYLAALCRPAWSICLCFQAGAGGHFGVPWPRRGANSPRSSLGISQGPPSLGAKNTRDFWRTELSEVLAGGGKHVIFGGQNFPRSSRGGGKQGTPLRTY